MKTPQEAIGKTNCANEKVVKSDPMATMVTRPSCQIK